MNFTGVYKPGNTYSDCSFSATATSGKGTASCTASYNLSGFNVFALAANPPATNADASTNLFNTYGLGGTTRYLVNLGSFLIGRGVLTERTFSISNSLSSCSIATSPQTYNWLYMQTRGVYAVPSSGAMTVNSVVGGTLVYNSNGYNLNGSGGIEAGTEALTQFTSTASFTLATPGTISSTPYNIVYKTNGCVQESGSDTAQRTYKKGAAPYSQITPLGAGGIMNVGDGALLFTDTQAIPTVAIATPVVNLTNTYGTSGHGYEAYAEKDVFIGLAKQSPQDATTFSTPIQAHVSVIADTTQGKFIIRDINPATYSSRTQGTVIGSIAFNTVTYDYPSTGFFSGTFSRTYNSTTYTGYATCLPGIIRTQNWLVCQLQGTISGHWDNRVLTSVIVSAPRSTAVRFLPDDVQNDAANSNGANQACVTWTAENLSGRSVASVVKSTVSPWPAKWDLGAGAFSSNNTGTDCKDYIPGFSSCNFQVCLNGTSSGVAVGAHFDALAFRVDDDGAGGDNDGNGSAYEEDIGIAYGVNDEFLSALVVKVGGVAADYFVLAEGTHTSGSPMDVDVFGKLEMDNSLQDISAVILGFPSIAGTLGSQGGITTDYSYNSGYTETTYLRRGADNLKLYLTGSLPNVGKFSETYTVPGSSKTITYVLNKDTDGDGAYDWSFTTPASVTIAADNCVGTSNANQADGDSDGIGTACDNCAAVSNVAQTDGDSDGVGNACDNCVSASNANQADGDSDGVGTVCDNCPSNANANQADSNSNGVGDVCDPPPNPSNLAGAVSGVQVTLTYTSGGGTTSAFQIAYQTGATAPSDCVSGTVVSAATVGSAVSYAIGSLNASTQYSFRVCAKDAQGLYSSGVTVSSTTGSAAPPDVTNLTATVNTSFKITLGYTSGGGSTAKYQIAYQSGGTAPANCSSGTVIGHATVGAATSYAVQNLASGTQYSFRVCAADSSNNLASGTTVSATTTASGTFDTSFDSDGVVTNDLYTGDDTIYDGFVDANGKIVVCGYSDTKSGSYSTWTLARYNANGSLDTSFDTDGKVTLNWGGTRDDTGYGCAQQADGKIIMVGQYASSSTSTMFGIARFNTDGSLDTTFDTDGKNSADFGRAKDIAYGVRLQSDGKAVVFGQSETANNVTDMSVMRFNTNGSLDTSFDTDGKVNLNIGTGTDSGYFGWVDNNTGKIYVAGICTNSNKDACLVRLNSNGSLDTGFNSTGKITAAWSTAGGSDAIQGITTDANGKVYVVGWKYIGSGNYDTVVARYNSDGSVDTNYATNGVWNYTFSSGDEQGMSIIIQADGKAVVAGYYTNSTNYAWVARLTTSGALDTTFNSTGYKTYQTTGGSYAWSVITDGTASLQGNYFLIAHALVSGVRQAQIMKIFP